MENKKIIKHRRPGEQRKRFDSERKRADLTNKLVKLIIGGFVGLLLTSLFSVVVVAFLIKAFVVGDQLAYQLLDSAIKFVGAALGAIIGYFFGRNNSLKS